MWGSPSPDTKPRRVPAWYLAACRLHASCWHYAPGLGGTTRLLRPKTTLPLATRNRSYPSPRHQGEGARLGATRTVRLQLRPLSAGAGGGAEGRAPGRGKPGSTQPGSALPGAGGAAGTGPGSGAPGRASPLRVRAGDGRHFASSPSTPLRRPRGLHGGGAAASPRPSPGRGAAGRPPRPEAGCVRRWSLPSAAGCPQGLRWLHVGAAGARGTLQRVAPQEQGACGGPRQPQLLCGNGLVRQGNSSAREISTALKRITSSL